MIGLLLALAVSAQTFSGGRTQVTLMWDPSEYATYYTLTIDSAGQIDSGCCAVSVIVNRGWHTYSLTASNESGTSEATVIRHRVR